MKEQKNDDLFEELLSTHAQAGYIEDNGFTDQLMLKLPKGRYGWGRGSIRTFGLLVIALLFVFSIGENWLHSLTLFWSFPLPAVMWVVFAGLATTVWVPLTIAFEGD